VATDRPYGPDGGFILQRVAQIIRQCPEALPFFDCNKIVSLFVAADVSPYGISSLKAAGI
jgi:hypothetical protein